MSTIEVSTGEFEFAHGRKPRGRGFWAFYFGFRRTRGGTVDPWFAPGSQTYGDAVKAAKVEARKRGFSFIEVAT